MSTHLINLIHTFAASKRKPVTLIWLGMSRNCEGQLWALHTLTNLFRWVRWGALRFQKPPLREATLLTSRNLMTGELFFPSDQLWTRFRSSYPSLFQKNNLSVSITCPFFSRGFTIWDDENPHEIPSILNPWPIILPVLVMLFCNSLGLPPLSGGQGGYPSCKSAGLLWWSSNVAGALPFPAFGSLARPKVAGLKWTHQWHLVICYAFSIKNTLSNILYFFGTFFLYD